MNRSTPSIPRTHSAQAGTAVLLLVAAIACSKAQNGAGANNGGPEGGSSGSEDSGSTGHPVPPVLPPADEPGCGLESPAFCETFDEVHEGGRGGGLDEKIWSMTRWGHLASQFFVRVPASREEGIVFPPTFCGESFSGILPNDDVRICEGIGVDGRPSNQLHEVFDDHGGFAYNSMRIRQLFDFTDGGTVVFDVDGKSNPLNVGHGWWYELWITEDPEPMPYHGAPTVHAFPRNGIGFTFRGFSGCQGTRDAWTNQLDDVIVMRENVIYHNYTGADFDFPDFDTHCFKTADGKLNRFKFVIDENRAEVWASDYNDPQSLRLTAVVTDLDLTFTRGYVNLQHAHYNANKDGDVTPSQTFRWDNVGFDGPKYPTPRGYDIEEPLDTAAADNGIRIGRDLPANEIVGVTAKGVDKSSAFRATLNFTIFSAANRTIDYRVNGSDWHQYTTKAYEEANRIAVEPLLRTYSVEVPLEEIVDGDNVIEFRMPPGGSSEAIANIDLTLDVEE